MAVYPYMCILFLFVLRCHKIYSPTTTAARLSATPRYVHEEVVCTCVTHVHIGEEKEKTEDTGGKITQSCQ